MGQRRGNAHDHGCPFGNDSLLRIRDVDRALRAPATNADVWTPEGTINALYDASAPICSQCWLAYLAPIDKWCRSLAQVDGFRVPLAPEVRDFPVPRGSLSTSTLVYNQLYGDGTYTESVGYWYERNDAMTAELVGFADKHALALDLEPGPPERHTQILVSASKTRRVGPPSRR